jgi:hypothetical protein
LRPIYYLGKDFFSFALSSAPKEEGKWSFHVGAFPLFTLNYFKCFGILVADMSLGIEWAGLLFGFGPD